MQRAKQTCDILALHRNAPRTRANTAKDVGRLAAGLQIGGLRLLGFIPADVTTAPEDAVRFVADQVDAGVDDVHYYTTRPHTISDYVTETERHLTNISG